MNGVETCGMRAGAAAAACQQQRCLNPCGTSGRGGTQELLFSSGRRCSDAAGADMAVPLKCTRHWQEDCFPMGGLCQQRHVLELEAQ